MFMEYHEFRNSILYIIFTNPMIWHDVHHAHDSHAFTWFAVIPRISRFSSFSKFCMIYIDCHDFDDFMIVIISLIILDNPRDFHDFMIYITSLMLWFLMILIISISITMPHDSHAFTWFYGVHDVSWFQDLPVENRSSRLDFQLWSW